MRKNIVSLNPGLVQTLNVVPLPLEFKLHQFRVRILTRRVLSRRRELRVLVVASVPKVSKDRQIMVACRHRALISGIQ